MVSSAFTDLSEPLIPWWLVLLQGIAAVIIGVLLLTQPGLTLLTLVIFLGVYWLISGIFDLVSLFIDRSNWGWKLVSGIIGILAGLVIVRHPAWSGILLAATLVWILAFVGMVIGVITLARAFTGGGWGVGILGVLSFLLGVALLFRPLVSAAVLVLVAAILILIGGVAAIIGSFWLRSEERAGRPQPPESRQVQA